MADTKQKSGLAISVKLAGIQDERLPDLKVTAFDANGQFLAATTAEAGGKGQVKFELPPSASGKMVRVVLGPKRPDIFDEVPQWVARLAQPQPERKNTPVLAEMLNHSGLEKRLRLPLERRDFEIAVLPGDWKKWLLCSCVVRGRLIKRVALPDGTTQDLGVCHACVMIYEVDKIPWIIYRLPERDLFRLRDDLLVALGRPLPDPPEPFNPLGLGTTAEVRTALSRQIIKDANQVATPVIPLPPPKPTETLLAAMDGVFRATSSAQLRTALLDQVHLLPPYICAFPWLWFKFKKDLIKCVCTDEQGRFETTIYYRCFGDKPDLYFKAWQCIGGSLHMLYDPGVACHTHWNYVCGTEVTLETDDPAAITCVPTEPVDVPPGVADWVMPYAVGGVRLDQIKPTGFTDFTDGNGTWAKIPFGGGLGFRHGYSSNIPYDIAGKPAFYGWLYNQLDSLGNETTWREFAPPVSSSVVRHYADYDLAHPELPPVFPAYLLGPQEKFSKHVYEFKPHQPPPLAGHKREWPVDDWFGDIYTGILESPSLPGGVASAAGQYKIKLVVYDKNGNLLLPGPGTFEFIVPTGVAADGTTILARKALAGEIEGGGFVFQLHIDNNPCQAVIYEAQVNTVAAGPCGFIKYGPGDDVLLSFKAYHPNGFGRFKFNVFKGSTGSVAPACAPAAPGAVSWSVAPLVTDSPNGYTHDASGLFTKSVDEAAIRGGCPKAAFGENLTVVATITNGWSRLSGLDASGAPHAFALEPV